MKELEYIDTIKEFSERNGWKLVEFDSKQGEEGNFITLKLKQVNERKGAKRIVEQTEQPQTEQPQTEQSRREPEEEQPQESQPPL